MRISLQEAKNRYGTISNDDQWANQGIWCEYFVIPDEINMMGPLGRRQNKIYCNIDMIRPLSNSLRNVINRGLVSQLKTFDGCLMIRSVRGNPSALSTHSYALAIDINASENKLGETPTMSDDLVKCFTDEGFSWGGNFKRKDGMHFSYAWE